MTANAQYFKNLAENDPAGFLPTVMGMASNQRHDDLHGLIDYLEGEGRHHPAFAQAKPMTRNHMQMAAQTFYANPVQGFDCTSLSTMFVRAIRHKPTYEPHADDEPKGVISAASHKLLDRVIDLYLNAGHQDILDEVLHTSARFIDDPEVMRKLAKVANTDKRSPRFGYHGDTDSTSLPYESSACSNAFEASLVLIRSMSPDVVRDSVASMLKPKIEHADHDTLPYAIQTSELFRVLRNAMHTTPHLASEWVDELTELASKEDAGRFRLAAVSSYLVRCLSFRLHWEDDVIDAIAGEDLRNPQGSPMAQALDAFAERTDVASWSGLRHAGNNVHEPKHIEPQFLQMVLATQCTPLFPLCERIARASADHNGPGLQSALMSQEIHNNYGRGDMPPPQTLRLSKTVDFLLAHGHDLHAPLAGGTERHGTMGPALHVCATTPTDHIAAALPVLLQAGAEPTRDCDFTGQTVQDVLEGNEERARCWNTVVRSFQARQEAARLLADLAPGNRPRM